MPFDFFDYLTPSGAEGTRRMRIFTGLIGAVLGGVIGYFVGHVLQETPAAPIINAVFGALIGGGLGALFSLYVVMALVIVVVFVGALLWNVYFGAG